MAAGILLATSAAGFEGKDHRDQPANYTLIYIVGFLIATLYMVSRLILFSSDL